MQTALSTEEGTEILRMSQNDFRLDYKGVGYFMLLCGKNTPIYMSQSTGPLTYSYLRLILVPNIVYFMFNRNTPKISVTHSTMEPCTI